jgi:hypothetical protein
MVRIEVIDKEKYARDSGEFGVDYTSVPYPLY